MRRVFGVWVAFVDFFFEGRLGLWVLIEGLIRNWMMGQGNFNLLKMGSDIIETHLESLRA